jgi:CRP/FNR family transcriptional regulator, cyclic AMP receptor protein
MPERVGYVRQARQGELVVRQGDSGSEMFVIQRGEVEIRKRASGRDVVLATLGRGEFFGEMSVLESLPRDADAIVVSDEASFLVIGQGALLMRLRRDPTFALEMMHALSRRVRRLTADLIERMGDGEP